MKCKTTIQRQAERNGDKQKSQNQSIGEIKSTGIRADININELKCKIRTFEIETIGRDMRGRGR